MLCIVGGVDGGLHMIASFIHMIIHPHGNIYAFPVSLVHSSIRPFEHKYTRKHVHTRARAHAYQWPDEASLRQ